MLGACPRTQAAQCVLLPLALPGNCSESWKCSACTAEPHNSRTMQTTAAVFPTLPVLLLASNLHHLDECSRIQRLKCIKISRSQSCEQALSPRNQDGSVWHVDSEFPAGFVHAAPSSFLTFPNRKVRAKRLAPRVGFLVYTVSRIFLIPFGLSPMSHKNPRFPHHSRSITRRASGASYMKHLIFVVCLFASAQLFAQQSNAAAPTTEDRVKALEDRIIALEGQLRVMQSNQQQAAAAATPTTNVSPTAPPTQTTPIEPAQ